MATFEGIGRALNPLVLQLKKMELELKCPTCLKFLNQPVLLPCDHILCSDCSKISASDAHCCPDCRLPYEFKDLKPATFAERFLTIYRSMSLAVLTLQQDLEAPSNRAPIFLNKGTHIHEDESFVDQGQLSSPIDNLRDSDSDNWNIKEQPGAKRKYADVFAGEGPSSSAKHTRVNDYMEMNTNVDLEGRAIENCAFCHSFRTTEASGEMLHFLNAKPVFGGQTSQPNVIHVHSKCLYWAPQIYFSGDTVVNLEAEIIRASKIKCTSCGKKGAALGCYVKSCRRSYHIPCAYHILECRWDIESYLVLCPVHTSRKLPCDKSKPKKSKSSSVEPSASSDWVSSNNQSKDWVICGSDLSKEEKGILDNFSRLSGLPVTYQWNQNVTHVIASLNEDGACIRTMKFLMAILNGRWVLNMGWIRACLEANHLVPEEKYEIAIDVHDCVDGPKTGRIRSMQKAPKLFNRLVFHFKGFTDPSYKSNLENLAIAGGGKVVSKLELHKFIIFRSPEIEKVFIIYSAQAPKGYNPAEIKMELRERREAAEAVAEETGTVVPHTLFLNAIAAYDLGMFEEL